MHKLSLGLLRRCRGCRGLSSSVQGGLEAEIEAVQRESQADREWARSPRAQATLTSLYTKTKELSGTAENASDMNSFLLQRGVAEADGSGRRALSATLTFPLTLSYGIRRVFGQGARAHEVKDVLNVLVLGARSESSLPPVWWREALTGSSSRIGKKLNIKLLGPGLQQQQQQQQQEKSSHTYEGKTVSVSRVEKGANLLHEHGECMKLLLENDLFVLFNSGLGSTQSLKESWAPTIKLLCMTRKPILLTAHSAYDLKRDLARLEIITSEEDTQDLGEPIEFIFNPHANPFASWKRTVDPKEEREAQIVTTNQFIYCVQAK